MIMDEFKLETESVILPPTHPFTEASSISTIRPTSGSFVSDEKFISSTSLEIFSETSNSDGSNSSENLSSGATEIQSVTNNKRKYFTKEEDQLLTVAAMSFNQESWNKIAKCVPGKSPKQCRDRWVNYLQPSLKFSPWNDREDQLLVSLVNDLGTHWTKMRTFFPNRSTNALKNRWYWLIKNRVKVINIQKSNIASEFKNINNANNNVNNHGIIFNNINNINNASFENNISFENNQNNQKNYYYYYLFKEKPKKKNKASFKSNQSSANDNINGNNDGQKKKNIINFNSDLNRHKIEDDILISFNSEELEW